MYRAVFDTNVIVSGTATHSSPRCHILSAWRNGEFILVTSPQILAEVNEVFRSPEIMQFTGLSTQEVTTFVSEIEKRAYVTEGNYEVWKIKNDPDDNIILACALEGSATHIVTDDAKSLLPIKEYHGVRIVNPADFLRAYLSNKN